MLGQFIDGVRLHQNSSKWVRQIVRNVHKKYDIRNDSFAHRFIVDALVALIDASNVDAARLLLAENVHLTTPSLLKWVGSHDVRVKYADRAIQKSVEDQEECTLPRLLWQAQLNEREDIFNVVYEGLCTRCRYA